MCRLLHQVLHRLMLQLLSAHFPGSYLIRCQEGELRYLAAFNTPTAAAAWCLTLTVSTLELQRGILVNCSSTALLPGALHS